MGQIESVELAKTYKFMKLTLWPFKRFVIITSAMILCSVLLICLREVSIKMLIDNISSGGNLALWCIGLLLVNDCLIEATRRVIDRYEYTYIPKIKQYIVQSMLGQMFGYQYSYYQSSNPAELSACICNLCDGMELTIHSLFGDFFKSILFLVVISCYAIIVSSTIALIFAVWGAVWLAAILYFSYSIYELTYQFTQAEVKLEGNLTDMFSHIYTIQSQNNSKHEIANSFEWTQNIVQTEQILRKRQFKLWLVQGFAFSIFGAGLTFYLVKLYTQGLASLGDLSLVIGFIDRLNTEMWQLAEHIKIIGDYVGQIGQSLSTLHCNKSQIRDSQQNIHITTGKIVFNNIRFSYRRPERVSLFDGSTSFTIESGQIVGLVGPSGSGKSTILKLILRLFELQGGQISIDGQDISQVSIKSLRDSIAVIPQDACIFQQRTIAENICYGTADLRIGNREQIMNRIVAAAQSAHAHEFISALPDGYDTVLQNYGIRLSGGQQQRIAIARGFMKDAKIFLFDEATAALDNVTQSHVYESIKDIIRGKTAIIVAHKLSTLADTDRVIVFEHGKIVQDGKHTELLKQPGLYSTMWSNNI